MSTSATARMPRAQRRTQLLELATRVFTEKGYQATSMDDIAAAAGVTKPVLYQHFDSKESLYPEVLDIIAEAMLDEVRALVCKGGNGAVYTQISDVEGELNGLLTYDRRVMKPDVGRVRAAQRDLIRDASRARPAGCPATD